MYLSLAVKYRKSPTMSKWLMWLKVSMVLLIITKVLINLSDKATVPEFRHSLATNSLHFPPPVTTSLLGEWESYPQLCCLWTHRISLSAYFSLLVSRPCPEIPNTQLEYKFCCQTNVLQDLFPGSEEVSFTMVRYFGVRSGLDGHEL